MARIYYLEADAHEDVATAHTDELLDDGVRLLGMDVLQHVRTKHLLWATYVRASSERGDNSKHTQLALFLSVRWGRFP